MKSTTKKEKFAILLDSSSGYQKSLLPSYDNIFIYPLTLIINYKDVSDTPENMPYVKMIALLNDNILPKTAQPNPLAFKNYVDNLLKSYEKIYVLPISELYSGAYNAMALLMKESKYKNKLFVFHTKSIFLSTTYLIPLLANDFQQGTSFNEMQTKINSYQNRFYYLLVPRDVSVLKASGRINLAKEFLLTVLKLKIVLKFISTAEVLNKVRSNNAALTAIIEDVNNTLIAYPDSKITILISEEINTELDINTFLTEIKSKNINFHNSLPNVILAHIGVVSYGVFVERINNDSK